MPELDPLTPPSPSVGSSGPLWEPVAPAFHPKFQDRVWLHALLFALTALTTTLTGLEHYAAFLSDFGANRSRPDGHRLGSAAWYSATILAILGAHEMGHYLACRYYRIDATLPYFMPMLGVLTGTFGAVIRIREPIL